MKVEKKNRDIFLFLKKLKSYQSFIDDSVGQISIKYYSYPNYIFKIQYESVRILNIFEMESRIS